MLSAQTSREIEFRRTSSRTTTSSAVIPWPACYESLWVLAYAHFLGAVNPRDNDLKIKSDGENLVFNVSFWSIDQVSD